MSDDHKKEEAILFFLNKYGILVEFGDDSYTSYKKTVKVQPRDTFKQWKQKVFNNPDAEIAIFGASSPANNTLFSNIVSRCSAEDFYDILHGYREKLNSENEVQMNEALKKLKKKR